MNPSQVSSVLRDIADRLDRSVCPDRNMVASSLRKVLHHISLETRADELDKSRKRLSDMFDEMGKALNAGDLDKYRSIDKEYRPQFEAFVEKYKDMI